MAPTLSALFLLFEPSYYFWFGVWYPVCIGGIALTAIAIVAVASAALNRHAPSGDLDERAMAYGAAAFAGLLGTCLILLAHKGSIEMYSTAEQLQDGCATLMPKAMALMDFSRVLYNIRLDPTCTERSVKDCKGWAENRYSNYLQYLEEQWQCGPLCAEEPFAAAAAGVEPPLPSAAPTPASPPPKGLVAKSLVAEGPSQRHPGRRRKHTEVAGGLLQADDVGTKDASSLASAAAAASRGRVLQNRSAVGGGAADREDEDEELRVGDLVEISSDRDKVMEAFEADPEYEWRELMPAMLGNAYRVLVMRGPDTVGLRSPDGTQNGIWYFPAEVVRQVWLPSAATAPQLFDEGETRMACFPLVAARLRILAFSFGDAIFWQGVCLVLAASLAGLSPVLAAMCCGPRKAS